MALALAWMIPGGAWGADLYLSASTALQYDSNVLRTENDQKDDIVFRGTPRLELREADGTFTYSLSYEVPYERGFTENRIDNFSHFFLTQAGYAWGGRNDLRLRNNLRYWDRINNHGVEDDDEVLRVNDEDISILTNDLTLSYNRHLTPRLAANLTLVNRIFETDQESRADNQTYGMRGSLIYALTSKHRLGGGFGGVLQNFEEAQGLPSSEATFFNVFGLWFWQIDPTTLFEIRGGPTLINISQGSQDDSSITFFGSASITKRWTSVLSSSLSYLRRGSTASGLSGATTLDSVTLSNTWKISELWRFDARGDWTQRKSISDSLQSFDDVDTQRWGVSARLDRVLGRNATASLSYSYNEQSSKSRSRGSRSDFGDHLVTVGFQYNFDPIRAW